MANNSENKKFTKFFSLFSKSEVEEQRTYFRGLKAKANARRTLAEKLADWMTMNFGSITFLLINCVWFVLWILINTGWLAWFPIFDPFPFSLLTMMVSLEAIILAIFVLISQNRSARLDDIREETHLQVNLIAEKEITKVMKMLAELMKKHGVNPAQDEELTQMLKPISAGRLEKSVEKEMHD